MSVLVFFAIWCLLSVIFAPIIGTVIKNNSTTLDEDSNNN
jgi:hypothetical protein